MKDQVRWKNRFCHKFEKSVFPIEAQRFNFGIYFLIWSQLILTDLYRILIWSLSDPFIWSLSDPDRILVWSWALSKCRSPHRSLILICFCRILIGSWPDPYLILGLFWGSVENGLLWGNRLFKAFLGIFLLLEKKLTSEWFGSGKDQETIRWRSGEDQSDLSDLRRFKSIWGVVNHSV